MAIPAKYQHLTDDELIRLYRQTADNSWVGYLLERYTVLLLGVAMKYLKDRNAAEDAVQQVFLKAITHFPKEEVNNFKGWLYILMRNHCFQELRDRTHALDEAVLAMVPATEDDDKHLAELTFEQLSASLDMLGEEQRVAITMFYLQKNSYEQICAVTGFSFMQVKSYIQNGKRNLKTLLLKKMNEAK